MKKTICLILTAALLSFVLAGCGGKSAQSAFTAANEIFTYQRIDPNRTQIVVSRTGNINVTRLFAEFEQKHPDVQIIYIDITGGNSNYKPLVDWVENGYAPDVIISAAGFFTEDMTARYFENLSTDPVIENYETAALNRTATGGYIYWLPGPSNITAMMYNKTLFERYGWSVPNTFDEFIDLCVRIREDTNGEVEPWNPNAKYDNELITALEAFVYEEIFGGVENRTWYNDFIRGNADFTGHMEPYYETIQKLIDAGVLREEHFTYSATARGKEFTAGKIAMINMNIFNADTDEYDFGYMPFPTTKGEIGYLCDSYNCFVGLPKKEHTPKEQDAIHRFIEFFSSSEGQQAYIDDTLMVSNVINVPLSQSEDLNALKPAIDAGHMFERMEFNSVNGLVRNVSLYKPVLDMLTGAKTAADYIAIADNTPYSNPDTALQNPPEPIASVEADMTMLETSFYIADAYREATRADIGLIAHNCAYRGNLMRFFAGDVTSSMVSVFKPRSFANDSRLVTVSMSGEQLMNALNAPVGNGGASDCVYAYSGLLCEIAPWNEAGKRYLSVKLADGKALDPARLYTVALWSGTVADEYITEVLETYDSSFEDMLTAKMRADGKIKPAADGRCKLVWK